MFNRRFASCAILIASFALPARGDDAKIPRYDFPVGRHLTYSMKTEVNEGQVSQSANQTWQIFVASKNTDGSAHLLFRVASSETQTVNGHSAVQQGPDNFGWANVFPDGRISPDSPLDMQLDPNDVFPRLPVDAKEFSSGWSDDNSARLEKLDFTASTSDKEDVFHFSDSGISSKIYETTQTGDFHFDPSKNLISSMSGKSTQSYGISETSTAELKLTRDEMLKPEEVAALGKSYDSLIKTQMAYEDKMKSITKHPEDVDKILTDAKKILSDALASADDKDIKTVYTEMLTEHDADAPMQRDMADSAKKLLGNPISDFQATDIDGKPVKLGDFDNKVIVLDFWYRGCGWCMYAMPEIKKVVDDFKDKPVVVLGMNNDADEKDARLVIDAQKLNYRTIKAAAIIDRFHVQGFPTMIVVDKNGIVREFDEGWSPTIHKDLDAEIQSLLDEK